MNELDELRARIKRNQELADGMPGDSDARDQLQIAISADTSRLIRGEQQLEQQREAARREEGKGFMVLATLIMTAIGGGITYVGWGTWWLLLGIPVTLLGIAGVVAACTDEQ